MALYYSCGLSYGTKGKRYAYYLAMDFISMDLIGEFRPPTSQGYKYALTVICTLTGFTWCIPIKSKNAEEIVKAYMREVYYKILRI